MTTTARQGCINGCIRRLGVFSECLRGSMDCCENGNSHLAPCTSKLLLFLPSACRPLATLSFGIRLIPLPNARLNVS